ncbi:MAG TPA: uracil-DNA glycosylase [Rhodospirillaceae bacterium]|nr:uracil-DNA glycosylase [Alphaproteobacteria bacterium]OUT41332.1 MAG: uracil-DNA glycosylase [Micavibrio sp. TMED2]HCI46466.1 uracil-DNA glycosylase [Rhodospirillaceae bacterium]MAS47139.1 uracil-DNA glycosylase [Alphaproteobacteria bacterium]MAX95234.1 uracil-DNA glycosylase [Alphaproteobacteria bacterium]|tara:strand:- start:640 stop:1230 length:591 start_codon:yes stop_codon:yes gene_type:complete
MSASLNSLLSEIAGCRLCAMSNGNPLPHNPRPVIQAAASAELLIVGQAPGTRVHETGIPWNDASGNRLRVWLQMEREQFYDPARIAIMPMGLCFPGQNARGADLPPRPECAPTWHDRVLAELPNIRTVLLIGQYAQARYLGKRRKSSMTDTVAHWRDYAPRYWPMPHPSWRNNGWLRKHGWFEADLLPALRAHIAG